MAIDYGHGITNIDPEIKIRYGIIALHSVMQAWCDSSEPYYSCEDCELEQGSDECFDTDCDLSSWYFNDEGYEAETCFDGTEIMIMKSPYFTWGTFCSPCAPGAINIDVPGSDGIAYCFGHDWFDEGKAPYKVFSVETGKQIFKWDYLLRYHHEGGIREHSISVYAHDIGEAGKEARKHTPDWMFNSFASSYLKERK